MNHIAIIGATGFLGTALTRRLLAGGTAVTAVIRPHSDHTYLTALGATIATGDITQPKSLYGLFDQVDGVIHAAGLLEQPGIASNVYECLHVEGTRNVLAELARLTTPPPLLYISSLAVLGASSIDEAANEKRALAPTTPYENSKALAETIVGEFARHGQPVVIVRPDFVYGPRDHHLLQLFQAIQQKKFFYVGRGDTICHPTYIDDLVEGVLLAQAKGHVGEIYHITGPAPVTFRELAETIAQSLHVASPWLAIPKNVALNGVWLLEKASQRLSLKPPIHQVGINFLSQARHASRRKAFQELGYVPQFSLAQGVMNTVSWYREQGLLEKM